MMKNLLMNRKNRRRFAPGALLACIVVAVMFFGTLSVMAAESSGEQTYTVRIFPGTQGSIDGSSAGPIIEQYTLGQSFNANNYEGRVTANAPYEYAGIHVAGQDSVQKQAFSVDKDIDLVVRYKIPGTTASYTIRYLSQAGTELRGSRTFSGSVGEELYIPYQEIPGYFPNTQNYHVASLTDGLVVTFVYSPNPAAPTPAPAAQATPATPATTGTGTGTTPATTGTGTTPATAGTATTPATAGTGTATEGPGTTPAIAGTGTAPAAEGTATAPAAEGTGTAPATTGTAPATEAAQTAQPEAAAQQVPNANALPTTPEEVPEVLEIGDEEVPLANVEDKKEDTEEKEKEGVTEGGDTAAAEEDTAPSAGLSSRAMTGIIAAIIAAVAVIAGILVSRARKVRNDDDDQFFNE